MKKVTYTGNPADFEVKIAGSKHDTGFEIYYERFDTDDDIKQAFHRCGQLRCETS
ncbi:hypothetical protein Barb4_02918 [Bacteroidales bacterium Barb4]|nr:hypothetical protein Barb4_02918 [Bacteroidales bacterium Barb4]